MPTITMKVGSRYKKVEPPHKIYRVIATVRCSGQPQHVRLAAEVDLTQVITVSTSALYDTHLWTHLE